MPRAFDPRRSTGTGPSAGGASACRTPPSRETASSGCASPAGTDRTTAKTQAPTGVLEARWRGASPRLRGRHRARVRATVVDSAQRPPRRPLRRRARDEIREESAPPPPPRPRPRLRHPRRRAGLFLRRRIVRPHRGRRRDPRLACRSRVAWRGIASGRSNLRRRARSTRARSTGDSRVCSCASRYTRLGDCWYPYAALRPPGPGLRTSSERTRGIQATDPSRSRPGPAHSPCVRRARTRPYSWRSRSIPGTRVRLRGKSVPPGPRK